MKFVYEIGFKFYFCTIYIFKTLKYFASIPKTLPYENHYHVCMIFLHYLMAT